MILLNFYKTSIEVGNNSIINSVSLWQDTTITLAGLPSLSKYYFYFKVVFILFLFVLHMFFIFNQDEAIQNDYHQNSLNNLTKILKEQASTIVALATYYAAYTNFNTAKINQEIANEQAESRKLLAKVDKLQLEGEASIKEVKTLGVKVKDFDMKMEQLKSNNISVKDNLDSIKKADNSITECLDKLKAISSEEEKNVLYAILLDEIQKRNHFRKDIEVKIDKNQDLANDMSIIKESIASQAENFPNVDSKGNNTNSDNLLEDSDIKKSIMLDPEWFNSLSIIKQLSVALLISQGVVLSALTSIIFIFYGQILIDKFNLEVKYPKLSSIIKYRKQFNKYYFIHSCIMIIIISLGQIAFSIAILSN